MSKAVEERRAEIAEAVNAPVKIYDVGVGMVSLPDHLKILNGAKDLLAALTAREEEVQWLRAALSDIMLHIVDEQNTDPAEIHIHRWWRRHAQALKNVPRPGSPERAAMIAAISASEGRDG